jgi:hypothetical protein
MKTTLSRFLRGIAASLTLATFSANLPAQQLASADLPDAPSSASSSARPEPQAVVAGTPTPDHRDPQTKRILGIFPNFRAVSTDTHLPAQSVKEKFVTASEDSFDYSSFVLPAALAGYSQETNATPEFHSGGAAYGRYFWHTLLDQTDENYQVEFFWPVLTHEDTRYYTLGPGHGGKARRAGYALSRLLITRNDAGKDTFNISEVMGAASAATISNFYYPRPERTASNAGKQFGTSLGVDAFTLIVREFWPDINHALFHGENAMEGTK